MRVRFESGLARLGSRAPRIKGRGMELRLTPKHLTCAAATGIPGSATTPRRPPTQAAKKCGIEPRLFPVPPAESPVDGAGAGRGRKDGPPDFYLGPLNPLGSPFFFGFQTPFLFPAGKKKWSLTVSPVLAHNRTIHGLGRGLARRVVAPHKIKCKWCHGRVWEAAPHTNAVLNPMANHPISPIFKSF